MPTVTIVPDLKALARKLGNLRAATPTTDPSYAEIQESYEEASDLAEAAAAVRISDADADYVAFSGTVTEAMKAIDDAMGKIEKVAKAVETASRVIDIADKIVEKV
jgi:hypothetical protein